MGLLADLAACLVVTQCTAGKRLKDVSRPLPTFMCIDEAQLHIGSESTTTLYDVVDLA